MQALIAEIAAALEEAEERAWRLPADSPEGAHARERAKRLRELHEDLTTKTGAAVSHEGFVAVFRELRDEPSSA
jgi:hypothetical protein